MIDTVARMARVALGSARIRATKERRGSRLRARKDARETVRRYYEACAQGDLEACMDCFADDVLIEDMIYKKPFVGKEEFRRYLKKVIDALPESMDFVIDDMTSGQDGAVGLVWHVEIQGKPFPFSRGCSFYRCDEQGKIKYGRDIPEPSTKPGNAALLVIKLVAPIIRALPPMKYPSEVPVPVEVQKVENEKTSVKMSSQASKIGLWSLYAVYFYWLILSPSGQAPGDPVYSIKPETLQEILDQSTNFFYINLALNAIGIDMVHSPVLEPVGEALFEFVAAWSLMFGPLLLFDRKGTLPRLPTWTGQMFLTNVFLIPYLATRNETVTETDMEVSKKEIQLGQRLARPFGLVGGAVGAVSVFWALLARPEFGSLSERFEVFGQLMATNRLSYAFVVDVILYAAFQPVLLWHLLKKEHKWLGFIPFFGLAAALGIPSLRQEPSK